jgi:hypothetical protein
MNPLMESGRACAPQIHSFMKLKRRPEEPGSVSIVSGRLGFPSCEGGGLRASQRAQRGGHRITTLRLERNPYSDTDPD